MPLLRCSSISSAFASMTSEMCLRPCVAAAIAAVVPSSGTSLTSMPKVVMTSSTVNSPESLARVIATNGVMSSSRIAISCEKRGGGFQNGIRKTPGWSRIQYPHMLLNYRMRSRHVEHRYEELCHKFICQGIGQLYLRGANAVDGFHRELVAPNIGITRAEGTNFKCRNWNTEQFKLRNTSPL